ncbi:hypothetical protein BB558_006676 [Smittium angustum]|uniref:Uncharacterized protein n=1 Tax=Smittium angustum TaxID=133377 RepID=A0A2U1IXB5_SMIAN|nr:hypothetical protein BB558_006676 [Smittium angustum]
METDELNERLDFLQNAAKTVFSISPNLSAVFGRDIVRLVDEATRNDLEKTRYSKALLSNAIVSEKPKFMKAETDQGTNPKKAQLGNKNIANTKINYMNRDWQNGNVLSHTTSFVGSHFCRFCGNLLIPGRSAYGYCVTSRKKYMKNASRHSSLLTLDKNKKLGKKSTNLKKEKGQKIEKETIHDDILGYGTRNSVSMKCGLCKKKSNFVGASHYKILKLGVELTKLKNPKQSQIDKSIDQKLGDMLNQEINAANKEPPKKQFLSPLQLRAIKLKKEKNMTKVIENNPISASNKPHQNTPPHTNINLDTLTPDPIFTGLNSNENIEPKATIISNSNQNPTPIKLKDNVNHLIEKTTIELKNIKPVNNSTKNNNSKNKDTSKPNDGKYSLTDFLNTL